MLLLLLQWEGAEMSAGDLLARLAIVPMSQEARGLDAGKRLAEKMVGWGDNRTAAIVHQIALEERNHVAVGEREGGQQGGCWSFYTVTDG